MHIRLSFIVGAVPMLAACADPSPRVDRAHCDDSGDGNDSDTRSAGSWTLVASEPTVVDVPLVDEIARRLWTLPPVRSRHLRRPATSWTSRRLSLP